MVNANPPSRQAKLKAWFLLNNLEQKSLAGQMGISEQLLSMTLHGKRATKERLDALVALGVPQELLPEMQERKRRGPLHTITNP